MVTFVLAEDGNPLMPTYNIKKVRKLLKTKRAFIKRFEGESMVIQLKYKVEKNNQPVEYSCDTGYNYVGISIKSEKHEFVRNQLDLLTDETERRNDRRKYRHTRRNRLRYRKPRFDNRKASKQPGWIAPSLKNKADVQINALKHFKEIIPISQAEFEVGQFDTQALKAIESGKELPKGLDYQHGERYESDTLREAILQRDNYTCIVCGKSGIKDGAILKLHHLGYKIGDRTNRMSNLATVCSNCHTSKNHKDGGTLYNLKPKLRKMANAAFMNTVKWYIYNTLKDTETEINFKYTYGAITKRTRLDLNISKSHTNDAYCIGKFRPKHRTKEIEYKKVRRNNRILEKFYDAKYIDIRDNKTKKGAQLSCGRTNRSEPRINSKNERIYRGQKVSKGKRSIRTKRYTIQPGDMVLVAGEWIRSIGQSNKGQYVVYIDSATNKHKTINILKIEQVRHTGGWIPI